MRCLRVRYRNVLTSGPGFVPCVSGNCLACTSRLVCGTHKHLTLVLSSTAQLHRSKGQQMEETLASDSLLSQRADVSALHGAAKNCQVSGRSSQTCRTVTWRNMAEACISNLPYCPSISLPSMVMNPNTWSLGTNQHTCKIPIFFSFCGLVSVRSAANCGLFCCSDCLFFTVFFMTPAIFFEKVCMLSEFCLQYPN